MYFNFKGKIKVYLEISDQLVCTSVCVKPAQSPRLEGTLTAARTEKANVATGAVPEFCQPTASQTMTNRSILLFIVQ